MSKSELTPGVPDPQTVFAEAPATVVDLEAEILANEVGEGEQPAPSVSGASTTVGAVDPTAAAMLRVAESMEKIVTRNESTRQLSYAEVLPVTPWNPTGKRNRTPLKRPTFMHGIQLNPIQMSEETIELFNQLKPGRYVDRKVEVQLTGNGDLNLQWAGGTRDKAIEMYTRFPDIDLLLRAIIAERKVKEEKRRAGRFDEEDEAL